MHKKDNTHSTIRVKHSQKAIYARLQSNGGMNTKVASMPEKVIQLLEDWVIWQKELDFASKPLFFKSLLRSPSLLGLCADRNSSPQGRFPGGSRDPCPSKLGEEKLSIERSVFDQKIGLSGRQPPHEVSNIPEKEAIFWEKKKGAKKEQHCSHFPANIIFFVRWEANPFLPPLGRPRTTKVTRVSSWRTIRVNSGMGHLAQIEDSILEIFWPSGNARVNSGFGPSNHQKCCRFRAEQVT